MEIDEQKDLEGFKALAQVDLEKAKFANALRVEEFKSLKHEIELLVRDTRSLELYVVGGLVAYYAWLLTHCIPETTVSMPFLRQQLLLQLLPWFVPIALPLLGAWRSWANVGRIMDIAGYIRTVEDYLHAERIPLGPMRGWEHYVQQRRKEARIRLGSHAVVWLLLVATTVLIASFGADISKGQCALAAKISQR